LHPESLKYGAGIEWKRSVQLIVRKKKKYTESRRKGISYIE